MLQKSFCVDSTFLSILVVETVQKFQQRVFDNNQEIKKRFWSTLKLLSNNPMTGNTNKERKIMVKEPIYVNEKLFKQNGTSKVKSCHVTF